MLSYNERFWAKVEVKSLSECWNWLGMKDPKGYGRFKWYGRTIRTARIAVVLYGRPVDDRLDSHHTCRNHSCVNPRHIEMLTRTQHAAKTLKKGHKVTHCPSGHAYDLFNTLHYRNQRYCRKCRNIEHTARMKRRRKALATASGTLFVPMKGEVGLPHPRG